jgi:hypothetical protein
MNKVCEYKGIPVYEDKYLKKGEILRNTDYPVCIIVAPDVSDVIKKFIRSDKLEDILGDG